MSETRINNRDIKKPLTQENLTLATGVNILVDVSGTNDIGTAAKPFDTIYADSFVGPTVSGGYVAKAGDTMTGSLTMSFANVLTAVSGVGNIGAAAEPFNSVFSDDAVLGGLAIIDGDIVLSNTVNILTSASGGSNLGSPSNPFGNVYAQNLIGPSGGFLNIAGGQMDGTLNFASGIGITFDEAGTSDIGEAIRPLGTLYVDNIVSSGAEGAYVNVTGDTMTGDLTMSGKGLLDATSLTGGDASIAFGASNVASGTNSQAFGNGAKAYGNNSHAEGFNTVASGASAHAEGVGTTADGGSFGAHAEGGNTQALGEYAHAEGSSTQAIGKNAHAEGGSTLAMGWWSHAEGNLTAAWGSNAHSEGTRTVASGGSSHSEGRDTATFQSATNSHAEGWDTQTHGSAAHAEGSGSIASGLSSHAGGDTGIAEGTNSFAHGGGVGYGYAGGIDSAAFFGNAYGNSSFAQGHNNSNSSDAYGNGAVAMGWGSVSSGTGAFSGGQSEALGNYATSFGQSTKALGVGSFAAGTATTASGISSVAFGDNSSALGGRAIAMGSAANANGSDSVAIGQGAQADGDNSFVFGPGHDDGFNNSVNFAPVGGENNPTGNTMVLSFSNGVYLGSEPTHLYPFNSGTNDLGSAALPFRRVYANEIIDSSGSSIYVEKAGDTMTGNLDLVGAIGFVIEPNSGANTNAPLSVIVGTGNTIDFGSSAQNNFIIGKNNLAEQGTIESIIFGTGNISTTGAARNIIGGVNSSGVNGAINSIIVGLRNGMTDGATNGIVGGIDNMIRNTSYGSFAIGSGNLITDTSRYSIVGGENNLLHQGGNHSFMVGADNTVESGSPYVFIAGINNTIFNSIGSINVGRDNYLGSSFYGFVGGSGNQISNNSNEIGTIVFGISNIVNSSSGKSAVFGQSNAQDNTAHTLMAGSGNSIGGGAHRSFVVGSNNNVTNGGINSLLTGRNNLITNGSTDSIVGGTGNTITNTSSQSVAFGTNNTIASAVSSFVFGNNLHASQNGTVIFGDSDSIISYTGNTADQAHFKFANGVVFSSGTDLLPGASGTNDIGSLALSFNEVHANSITATGINGQTAVLWTMNDVPTPAADGIVANFALANSPFTFDSIQMYKNGVYMAPSGVGAATEDYELISGNTIKFFTAPGSGSTLIANYTHL